MATYKVTIQWANMGSMLVIYQNKRVAFFLFNTFDMLHVKLFYHLCLLCQKG